MKDAGVFRNRQSMSQSRGCGTSVRRSCQAAALSHFPEIRTAPFSSISSSREVSSMSTCHNVNFLVESKPHVNMVNHSQPSHLFCFGSIKSKPFLHCPLVTVLLDMLPQRPRADAIAAVDFETSPCRGGLAGPPLFALRLRCGKSIGANSAPKTPFFGTSCLLVCQPAHTHLGTAASAEFHLTKPAHIERFRHGRKRRGLNDSCYSQQETLQSTFCGSGSSDI